MNRLAIRIPLAATLVAALTGAAALAPQAAYAANLPGLQYIVAETEFTSSVYKSINLYCPVGQRVVGGGFSLVGAPGSVVLDDFIPTTDHLTVGAGEVVGPGEPADGTTASWKVHAVVACSAPPPGLEIVVAPSSFGPGTDRRATAICPSGKTLISAGASLSNGWGQIGITAMDFNKTVATAFAADDEDGYSGSWSVTSYAVCASIPQTSVQILASAPQSAPGTVGSTTGTGVLCPAGTHGLGAGWGLSSTEQLVATAALVGRDGDVNDLSIAAGGSVDANGRVGTWTLTSIGACVNA